MESPRGYTRNKSPPAWSRCYEGYDKVQWVCENDRHTVGSTPGGMWAWLPPAGSMGYVENDSPPSGSRVYVGHNSLPSRSRGYVGHDSPPSGSRGYVGHNSLPSRSRGYVGHNSPPSGYRGYVGHDSSPSRSKGVCGAQHFTIRVQEYQIPMTELFIIINFTSTIYSDIKR